MCSDVSALGFRIGGQPQNLDYGGGDKSGLTDIEKCITFPSLARPGSKPTCVIYMGSNVFLVFDRWKGFEKWTVKCTSTTTLNFSRQ